MESPNVLVLPDTVVVNSGLGSQFSGKSFQLFQSPINWRNIAITGNFSSQLLRLVKETREIEFVLSHDGKYRGVPVSQMSLRLLLFIIIACICRVYSYGIHTENIG